MNKKQISVFVIYIIVEVYVLMMPLPMPQEEYRAPHRHHGIVRGNESMENETPQRVDVVSWVSIFFFMLFIAATFYRPKKQP